MGRSKRGTSTAEVREVSTRQLRSRAKASSVAQSETPLERQKSSRRGRNKTSSNASAEQLSTEKCESVEQQEIVAAPIRDSTPPTEEDILLGYCEQINADEEKKEQPVDAEVKEASSPNNQSSFSECETPKDDFSHLPTVPDNRDCTEVPQQTVEEETNKEEGEEDDEARQEKEEHVDNVVDTAEKPKVETECVIDNTAEEVVDVQILREESPSFSPPPTPPVQSDQPKNSNPVIVSSTGVSVLTSNDIKSLNVETKFKLEVNQQIDNDDEMLLETNTCQETDQVRKSSPNEEALDYVDEIKANSEIRQPDAAKFECLPDVFSLTPEDQSNNEITRLSPARNPPTCVIHVRGLVRPYLTNQLKTLLSLDAPIVDSLFWIDRIKSHCFATYESVEAAQKTRDRLHGLCWPSGSPKNLNVDFSTAEERDSYANEIKEIRYSNKEASKPIPPKQDFVEKKPTPSVQDGKIKKPAVREWDIPKLEKQKELSEKNVLKEAKSDAKTESNKVSKQESGKLLDDLFKKTKAKPSIYWLPLTEEQARRKRQEEEARQRMVAKRIEESRMLRMAKKTSPPRASAKRWREDRRRRRSHSNRSISRHRRRYRSRSIHAPR